MPSLSFQKHLSFLYTWLLGHNLPSHFPFFAPLHSVSRSSPSTMQLSIPEIDTCFSSSSLKLWPLPGGPVWYMNYSFNTSFCLSEFSQLYSWAQYKPPNPWGPDPQPLTCFSFLSKFFKQVHPSCGLRPSSLGGPLVPLQAPGTLPLLTPQSPEVLD